MSSRVLRRLREEQEREKLAALELELEHGLDGVEEENMSEEEEEVRVKPSSFAYMMDDDDSDSDSDSDSEDNASSDDDGDDDNENDDMEEKIEDTEEEEEDFDAILSEFKDLSQDANGNGDPFDEYGNGNATGSTSTGTGTCSALGMAKHILLLQNNDTRDYDLDYAIRNMLHGTTATTTTTTTSAAANKNKGPSRRSKKNLFAQHRDSWGKKPTSLIGGGIGMKTIDIDIDMEMKEECEDGVAAAYTATTTATTTTTATSSSTTNGIPWPYTDDETLCPNHPQQSIQWYTFERSNTYTSMMNDYNTYIANSGDINALAMFVADNPFIVEPMFHLAMFFFSMGENERGIELIKRILWVLEHASLSTLMYPQDYKYKSKNTNTGAGAMTMNLMQEGRKENEVFFAALFRLVQTSCMIGCVATSLATSRFLLSLDPWLDPMGVLLVMDYYALATRREDDIEFLIDLVESDVIKVCHESGDEQFVGHICDMPNWSYSYAFALYRKSLYVDDEVDDESEEDENGNEADGENIDSATNNNDTAKKRSIKQQADDALAAALCRFPFIPRLLLEKNNVNVTTARSFQSDWPAVMGPLEELNYACNTTSVEKVASIFVERSYKLWSGDDVQKWLYEGCQRVIKIGTSAEDAKISGAAVDADEGGSTRGPSLSSSSDAYLPSPSLDRYLKVDPMDYQDSFRRIPVDVNPLDPGVRDAALNFTPNRRRFLRMNHMRQGGRGGNNEGGIDIESIARQQQEMLATLLGAGRDGMAVIDPDLPLAEVFWRSMMPWARVEGVPPAPAP